MAYWDKITSRGNVEDRRSMAPVAFGGLSLTGIAFYLLLTYLSGGDLGDVLGELSTQAPVVQQNYNASDFEGADSYEVFASTVLGSNNDLWSQQFSQNNLTYTPPKLVLFRQATQSSCGTATSQVGPHYCPYDKTIYLDETFFDELTNRLGAQGGDVAQAYVISHEVGHHVQSELGVLSQVQSYSQRNPDQAQQAAIMTELQADCFAGLWVNSIKDLGVLEPNEVVEAMDAAEAVGDDRIQERVTGYVNPESWTHGSSEQRAEWFMRGYDTGRFESCNTFE